MCQDCPSARKGVRAVARELTADVLLPFLIYGLVIGALIAGGAWRPF